MLPPQQCLEPADTILLQIEDRLEIEPELPALERLAQIELELSAFARSSIEPRFEEAEHAAPILFRAVQGEIGVLQQRVGVGAIGGADCDADAGARRDLMPIDL